MPKANGKQSAQQSNKGSNDRFGIKREAENESVFSESLHFVPLHLTRFLEMRESC